MTNLPSTEQEIHHHQLLHNMMELENTHLTGTDDQYTMVSINFGTAPMLTDVLYHKHQITALSQKLLRDQRRKQWKSRDRIARITSAWLMLGIIAFASAQIMGAL